jgi:hypothetical protein
MGCDCFTEHTDVRHQCSVFQDYLNKGGEA